MTIKNFTFFSPSGTEFPVGSNNDGKLYMMLTGMDYGTIRRKDWSSPVNTALNVQYTNTSIIAGGRYFELLNETVALKPNSVNYIHANIDLSQTKHPVSLSAENSNNSNNVDLNNNSGVLKVVIDIRTTNGTGVISDKTPDNVTYLDKLNTNSAKNSFGTLAGVNLLNDWYVQEMAGGLYRLSRIINVNNAVDQRWGPLYVSAEIGIPSLPRGFSQSHITVSMSNTSNLMWCSITSNNGFRLISGDNTRGAVRSVLVEVFATKTL
ncbi:receptor binding tail protein [Lactococcus phage 96401]|uniref:Receptor binding protein n=1 Tax=Lactococcus phage 96401 TaxID=2029674 RepID=A0A343JQU0_9CAUD|nr:receptor binding tail protein [Lactococcus phage 96401]ASZ71863.1 receptor binding protein [Lactococcus phage 96401]